MKTCSKCKVEQPFDQFYNDKSRKDGKNPHCKTCFKNYQEAHKAEKAAYDKEYYAKTGEKYREMRNRTATEWSRDHREICNERQRERRLADPEKEKERQRKWYRDNAEKKKAKHREYAKTPAGKLSNRNQAHRRRSQSRETDITTPWLLALKEISLFCPLCGVKMTTHQHFLPTHKELDHIIPLCVGGSHTMDNVRFTCKTCNLHRPRDGSDCEGAS